MAIESAKINNIEITDEMKSLAENMTKASGRSELKMYKNGFDLWLNSFQTSLVAVGGSAAFRFFSRAYSRDRSKLSRHSFSCNIASYIR